MTESFVAGDRISGPDGSTGTIICGPDSAQDVVVRWDDHTRWPLEYSAEHVYAPELFTAKQAREDVRHVIHCTASDDGMLRTHDDARAFLSYFAPGARLEIRRPVEGTARESTRSYRITMERFGEPEIVTTGMYSLPVPAARMTTYLRGEIARATRGQ